MKRKTDVEKEPKKDIFFTPTKEIQDLGFNNIFFAYDESKEVWSLHLLYRRVVVSNNNSSATTVKEEQKQEEQQQPSPPSYEERQQIAVDGCDPDRYIPTNNAIRSEFEREKIDKLTMEKFIDHFWEMNLQQKQQAIIRKVTDGKQLQEAKTTPPENSKEELTTTNSSPNYPAIQTKVNPSTDLDPYIPDRDYAEFAIKTIKKPVKQEDRLIRQILYTGLSKDSLNPINLAVLAPTSEGKTYAVVESVKYFPERDVWMIGSMTPKVIIRQNGVLVDSNNQPLKAEIKQIQKQIKTCKDNDKKCELEEQLRQIYQESKILIDLSGKLFVFLEPPHPETWTILKPILSHDKYEIEHSYVYKVEGMGFSVKRVVTRGWPACIFCSAKNESNWPEWPEIASRFIITSPNMIPQKYLEGNILIAQQTGLPKSLRQHLIVSDDDLKLAKNCVLYLIQQIKIFKESAINNDSNSVWIPFGQILAEILPSEKGTDNRFTKRLFAFLTIITLSRSHLRSILELGSERMVITDLNDFSEVLRITQNLSMMPPFKLEFLKQYVIPAFKLKQTSDKRTENDGQEEINGVTSREISKYYKEKTGKEIPTNNLKQIYLNEYIHNGLIDQQDSQVDRRQKIYFPLIGLSENDGDSGNDAQTEGPIQRITKLSISNQMDNILQQPTLLIPRNCMDIPEDWLKLEILDLLKYPFNPDKFELYNKDNERICMCTFIKEYEKTRKLNGYFSKPISCNYRSKIFGTMRYFKKLDNKQDEKLPIRYKMDNFFISDKGAKNTSAAEVAANTSNNLYSQMVLLKNIKNQGGSSSNSSAILHSNTTYEHKYRMQEQNENSLELKFQNQAVAIQKEALSLPKNKLELFLQAFDELENEPKVNSALEDADKKDTVDGRKLKQLLVAKCVFSDVGEAHSFIQQMVLSNQLEEVGFETYKRSKDGKNA